MVILCYFYIQVSSEADRCLSIVLAQYDPHRCLSVSASLKCKLLFRDFEFVA